MRTAKVTPAAIKLIKEARKAGHVVTFYDAGQAYADGRIPVAGYSTSPYSAVTIFACGDCEEDFWGEDAGVEEAIERRNDAIARDRQWAEDQEARSRGLPTEEELWDIEIAHRERALDQAAFEAKLRAQDEQDARDDADDRRSAAWDITR